MDWNRHTVVKCPYNFQLPSCVKSVQWENNATIFTSWNTGIIGPANVANRTLGQLDKDALERLLLWTITTRDMETLRFLLTFWPSKMLQISNNYLFTAKDFIKTPACIKVFTEELSGLLSMFADLAFKGRIINICEISLSNLPIYIKMDLKNLVLLKSNSCVKRIHRIFINLSVDSDAELINLKQIFQNSLQHLIVLDVRILQVNGNLVSASILKETLRSTLFFRRIDGIEFQCSSYFLTEIVDCLGLKCLDLAAITHLSLAGNALEPKFLLRSFGIFIKSMAGLRSLDLSENDLGNSLADIIGDLRDLKSLRLRKTNLEASDIDFLANSKLIETLEHLDFGNCNLIDIAENVQTLIFAMRRQIKYLEMANVILISNFNYVCEIMWAILDCEELTLFDYTGNCWCSDFFYNLVQLPKLRQLTLSYSANPGKSNISDLISYLMDVRKDFLPNQPLVINDFNES